MTDAEGQTLRQRRAAATALNIERHAVALVLEHGLENVTVDMICEASGVSQRTFFNYFGTKDAAILGAVPTRVNEHLARAFIASDGKNVLGEALGLITLGPSDMMDEQLGAARIRVIAENPSLFRKQMERLATIEADITDILFHRLRRAAPATESPEETRELAALAAQLLAGTFRHAAMRWAGGDASGTADILARTAELLDTLLPRLSGR